MEKLKCFRHTGWSKISPTEKSFSESKLIKIC